MPAKKKPKSRKRTPRPRLVLIPAFKGVRFKNPLPIGRWLRISGLKIRKDGLLSIRRPKSRKP